VSLLAKRRLSLVQSAASSSTPPININFAGLSELLSTSTAQSSAAPTPGPLKTTTNNSEVLKPRYRDLPDKITMEEFCARFRIAEDICQKLTRAKFTGPHAFANISNEDLMTEAGLCRGEVADIRDGEMRWLWEDEKYRLGIWD
jgi:hypothetical protein